MRPFCTSIVVTSLAASALALPLNTVSVGDLPGTNGSWQVGEVTVAAPPDEVQRWFSEATQWAPRFSDDAWSRDLGHAPDGTHVAEFYSRVLGRALTVRLREQPGLIAYDGSGKGITTQGKIYIMPAGPGRTRVVMQTSGQLHGALGAVVSERMKRKRALNKLEADLNAVVRLANSYATTRRRGG
jgi:hypothetical protein